MTESRMTGPSQRGREERGNETRASRAARARRVLGAWTMPLLTAAHMITCATPSQAGLQFNGSMYSDLSLYHFGALDADSLVFGGRNTLTVNVKNVNREHGKVEGSLDLLMLYGAQADAVYGAARETLPALLAIEGAPLLLDLRELYFAVYLPFVDMSLGRQIVNFGKGFIFSPVDVFSSVDIVDLTFRRHGSDVVAARFPLGTLAGVDLISGFPSGDAEYASAAKVYANVAGFDWSAVGIYTHRADELTVGASFKGDIKIGVYGEAAERFVGGVDERSFEAMLGGDYSFLSNDLVVQAEYLHVGKPDSVGALWGKNNAFASVTYRINDIMNVSANAIHNFTADATIATLQYFYNILQNVDAVAYVRGYRGALEGFPAFPDVEYAARVEVKF
jgi:hypothetical protein